MKLGEENILAQDGGILAIPAYPDYEQSTIDYMQNNWGLLVDGASIDIYEWTASPKAPEEWARLVDRKDNS